MTTIDINTGVLKYQDKVGTESFTIIGTWTDSGGTTTYTLNFTVTNVTVSHNCTNVMSFSTSPSPSYNIVTSDPSTDVRNLNFLLYDKSGFTNIEPTICPHATKLLKHDGTNFIEVPGG